MFHAYNGPKRVLGVVPVEDHDGDIENFIVKLRKGDLKAVEYKLSAHGDYLICAPGRLETSSTGTPIVYAAVNSHALYPEPATYLRQYGFGNDVAAKGAGTQTIPQKISKDTLALRRKGGRLSDKMAKQTWVLGKSKPGDRDISVPWKVPAVLVYATMAAALVLFPSLFCSGCVMLGLSVKVTAITVAVIVLLQAYILKFLLTGVFTYLGSPRIAEDTWFGWLLPMELR